jgi:hypothetical protein
MKRIAAVVITLHCFLLGWVAFFENGLKKNPPKKLTINQYVAKSVTKKTTPSPSPSAKKKSSPSKSLPQKTPPKQVKKEIPKVKPSPLAQKLVRELEESIAKIEGSHDKVDTSLELETPRTIDALKIESFKPNLTNDDYTGTLILCLQQSLNLPDFGEVKIKLTLRHDGTVEQLTVLKAESENNRRYLETHLPHVKFPALNNLEHTFVLTFCNEV